MRGVPFPMSRSRILGFILIAIASTAVAQIYSSSSSQFGQAQRRPPAQTGDVTLTGTVVNSVTGEPIPHAMIQMMGMASRVALTDSEGKFEFDNLPETQAMLQARKPGYFSEMELRRGQGRIKPINITAGMGSVTVPLTPAGVVTGRVTTADGEPLESVRVRLKVKIIQNGRRQWMNRNGANTDEDGFFRIGNLQPGTYYLFTDGGGGRLFSAPDETIAPTYFPGVNDVSAASPLEVKPGNTTIADLVLRKEKAYHVSGVVTGLQAGQGANVQLVGPGGDSLPIGGSVNAGSTTFELRRVPAGTYTLKVTAQTMGPGINGMVRGMVGGFAGGGGMPRMPQTYTGSVPITVSGDLTGVTVALQPSTTIPVSVRTEFANKSSESEGAFFSMGRNSRPFQQYVNLHLVRADGTEPNNQYYAQMVGSQENMSLAIQNVEPGRYRVEFMPMGNNYIKSATYGNTDLLRDEMVVTGGDSLPIDVVVRDDAAQLSGTARCADMQCWVLVLPESNPALQARFTYVNPQGTFQEMGLAPGTYRVYAFDRSDGIEFTNPDVMKSYGARSETVVLSAGQKAQVNVELTKVSDQ